MKGSSSGSGPRAGCTREMFERLLGLCNDVGLLAEEYDPANGRQLGNFPQAFSHLALINTALNLDTYAGPATQRCQAETQGKEQ
jgi:GH15 family glucan-1,4-alpha-glucosidase